MRIASGSIVRRARGLRQVSWRPRPETDPADGSIPEERHETWRRPRARLTMEPLAIRIGVRVRPVEAANAEILAPAPLRVAALAEQGGERVPALGRQRLDDDFPIDLGHERILGARR